MIAFIRGPVAAIEDDALVIDKNGIGVTVAAPISQLRPLPALGDEIFLHTHFQVREDGWTLFGFSDREQLRIFRLLLSVSGIGAKTALVIVDTISTLRFGAVVAAQEVKPLTAVSGVGKKTAERILLELKDKFPTVEAGGTALPEASLATDELNRELLAALRQLGYTATEARAFALQAESALGRDAAPELLLREAIRVAAKS